MNVRMDDNHPTRFIVSSETDGSEEYVVDIAAHRVVIDGRVIFNGVCGLTDQRIHGCRDFIMRKWPRLKDPANHGRLFRCKHIDCARAHALDFVLPFLVKANPNLDEEQMT